MKTKKLFWVLAIAILLVVLVLAYIFRPMTMNDIYDKPNFAGIVSEVTDKAILVSVNEDEEVFKSSDIVSVSLDVKLKDSMTHFNVGDRVSVYYDGSIAESYPAQVNTVYAIIFTAKGEA